MSRAKPQPSVLRERRWQLISFLSILFSSLIFVVAIDGLLVSCVLAFVIAYLFAPFVDWLERKGLSRGLSTFIPFFIGGLAVIGGITLILPMIIDQGARLVERLPTYQSDLVALSGRLEAKYSEYLKFGHFNPSTEFNSWLIRKTADLSSALPNAVSRSLTVLILSPFFAFFMLQDGNSVSRSLLSFVPNPLFEIALNLRHQINDQLGGFIRARFLEAAIVGAVVWIGLQILGFPYASLLALFAAVTNLIPYVGPIIGAVPALLIALVSDEPSNWIAPGASQTLTLAVVGGIYFFAQLIDAIFIIPLVVAKIVNLHPVTVVIMIIAGAEVAGILGMVISIPVASAIKLTFRAFYSHLTHFRDA